MDIHTEELHGYTIRVVPDVDPMDPREWDNLGRMVCFHRDYVLGDSHGFTYLTEDRTADEIERIVREEVGARVALPLFLLDHSSLSIRAGSPSPFDPGGWDTSMVGWIMDTSTRREVMGCEDFTDDELRDVLLAEVREYDYYLTGQVYGFVVEDRYGYVVESCFGFYDEDDVLSVARGTVEFLYAHEPQPSLPGMEV